MFYRSYRITLKIGKKADPFPSLGLIGLPIIFNFLTLLKIITIITKSLKKEVTLSDKYSAIIFVIFLFLFLFRYLVIDERRLAIFREFDKQTDKQKWILNISVIIYLVLTVYLFDYFSDIIRNMHSSGVL